MNQEKILFFILMGFLAFTFIVMWQQSRVWVKGPLYDGYRGQHKRFGKLTVIGWTGKGDSGSALYECVCDCGNTCEVPIAYLVGEVATSCGCCATWRPAHSQIKRRAVA